MTCLEAQSNIMKFIDKKLPDDKVTDFVRHIRHCPNCAEELEISFTLIVGMRQLDNNEEMYHNFNAAINTELERIENRIKNARRFKVSTFSVIFAVIVFSLLVLYDRGLAKVYSIEQVIKKTEQGKEYFYDTFNPYLEICNDDMIIKFTTEEKKPTKTFYEQVRFYNFTHPKVEVDEDDKEENNTEDIYY